MSSTNRGAIRHPDDFYATPRWCTWAVVPALERLGLRPRLTSAPLRGFELDEARAKVAREIGGFDVTTRDALSADGWGSPSLAMTNPPFSLALEFAQRGLAERVNTLLLLRLNFLGSAERAAFHRAHPAHIFSLGRRPSFGLNKDGKKGTDSCEYGWFGWGPAFTPNRWEPLDLALVPPEDRLWERKAKVKPPLPGQVALFGGDP